MLFYSQKVNVHKDVYTFANLFKFKAKYSYVTLVR